MPHQKEKRKFTRKSLSYPAKIDCGDGQPLRECRFRDISVTGARLLIGKDEMLPKRFKLLLSTYGKPFRNCRVAWRSQTETGVQFER
jgi:hypothetical protein